MAKGKYAPWLEPDGLLLLEAWARDGLTDEEIAAKIGITPSTLYVWVKKYSEISEAIKKGKEIVDIQVENALLKKALGGFEITEKTYERIDDTQEDLVVTKKVVKQLPPDVAAMIFWLRNRRPDKWRGNRDTEHAGNALHATGNDPITEALQEAFKDGNQ